MFEPDAGFSGNLLVIIAYIAPQVIIILYNILLNRRKVLLLMIGINFIILFVSYILLFSVNDSYKLQGLCILLFAFLSIGYVILFLKHKNEDGYDFSECNEITKIILKWFCNIFLISLIISAIFVIIDLRYIFFIRDNMKKNTIDTLLVINVFISLFCFIKTKYYISDKN